MHKCSNIQNTYLSTHERTGIYNSDMAVVELLTGRSFPSQIYMVGSNGVRVLRLLIMYQNKNEESKSNDPTVLLAIAESYITYINFTSLLESIVYLSLASCFSLYLACLCSCCWSLRVCVGVKEHF